VNDELTEKVARAILEDEQKSAEASGCDILLLLHEGHRAAARAAIRIVVEECAKVADEECAVMNEQRDEIIDKGTLGGRKCPQKYAQVYAYDRRILAEGYDQLAAAIRKLAQYNNGEVA
jgi:hypothetical protein